MHHLLPRDQNHCWTLRYRLTAQFNSEGQICAHAICKICKCFIIFQREYKLLDHLNIALYCRQNHIWAVEVRKVSGLPLPRLSLPHCQTQQSFHCHLHHRHQPPLPSFSWHPHQPCGFPQLLHVQLCFYAWLIKSDSPFYLYNSQIDCHCTGLTIADSDARVNRWLNDLWDHLS